MAPTFSSYPGKSLSVTKGKTSRKGKQAEGTLDIYYTNVQEGI